MFGKKKESLFGKRIDTRCEYCANSTGADGADCRLHRTRDLDGTCRFFSYDPLKRAPETLPPIPPRDEEEFQL